MSNFIKDSQQELKHVVWPTPTETKKYFQVVVGVIIFVAVFLSLAGYIVQNTLHAVRVQTAPTATESVDTNNIDIEAIKREIEAQKALSGTQVQISTGVAK